MLTKRGGFTVKVRDWESLGTSDLVQVRGPSSRWKISESPGAWIVPLGCPVRPGNKALQVEFGDGKPSLITAKIIIGTLVFRIEVKNPFVPFYWSIECIARQSWLTDVVSTVFVQYRINIEIWLDFLCLFDTKKKGSSISAAGLSPLVTLSKITLRSTIINWFESTYSNWYWTWFSENNISSLLCADSANLFMKKSYAKVSQCFVFFLFSPKAAAEVVTQTTITNHWEQ